ncbi:hypothetical protein HYU21_00995, partial [Candidatus Woesearchaeota archaeon]|nr:hypothetical protein [Candidatus Woesearchaeota archaeon]
NNYTALNDGRYLLNASGNDTSGNRAETETRNITIDTATPSSSSSSSSSGGASSGGGGGGCPSGQVLSNGQCQSPTPAEEKVCDCTENEVCVEGTCQTVEEEKNTEPVDTSEQKETAQKIDEALEQLKEKAALTGQAFFNRLFSSSSKQYYAGLALLILLSVLLVAPIKVRKVIIKRKLKKRKEELLLKMYSLNTLHNKPGIIDETKGQWIEKLPVSDTRFSSKDLKKFKTKLLQKKTERIKNKIYEKMRQFRNRLESENEARKKARLEQQKQLMKQVLLQNAQKIKEEIQLLKQREEQQAKVLRNGSPARKDKGINIISKLKEYNEENIMKKV